MSQGKENSSSLISKIRKMTVRKPGVTRSGRPSTSRYAVDEGARVGRGGGRGGVDVAEDEVELPSASGDVASQSRHEVEDEEEDEVEDEAEDEVELAPKRPRMRGEAGVPDEDMEPRSEEAKALIVPQGVE